MTELRKAAKAATPGPWDVWAEKCPDPVDAKIELAEQVDRCEQFVGELYLLNAAGKCPATTGCGPTSKANATFIAAANPQAVLSLLDERDAIAARVTALEAENEKLREGVGIYTASKTVHAPMWKSHRSDGIPIISTWLDEAGKGETKSFDDLWTRCVAEAASCAALVVYREPGEVLKGALVEIGAALASGRPVYFVGDLDGYSFASHPLVTVVDNIPEALRRAAAARGKE